MVHWRFLWGGVQLSNDSSDAGEWAVIPTFESQLAQLGDALHEHRYLGMILIDIQPLSHIERVYGAKVYDRFVARVGQMLLDLRGKALRKSDTIAMSGEHGEQFMVF